MTHREHVRWSDSLSTDSLSEDRSESSEEEFPLRGTSIRTAAILPPYHMTASRSGSQQSTVNIIESHGMSPQNTEPPFFSMSVDDDDDEDHGIESLVLEPTPSEYVPSEFSERVEARLVHSASGQSSSSESPETPGVILNIDPFGSSPKLSKLSGSSKDWRFKTHRDTFALLDLPRRRYSSTLGSLVNRTLPLAVYAHLHVFLDHASYLALRLTSHDWCNGLTAIRPLALPAVYSVPTEIIQEIYKYLSPIDFNAARHTCQSWMNASLHKFLLIQMIRKGGWWESVDIVTQKLFDYSQDEEDCDDTLMWLMNKTLATECALRPDWTGNGLSGDGTEQKYQSLFELVLDSDFSDLSNAHEPADCVPASTQARNPRRVEVRLTASICGRFALAVKGCIIFVYRLCQSSLQHGAEYKHRTERQGEDESFRNSHPRNSASIQPITRIYCPRLVLMVSMDTSLGRYAVAALLDDRMGLVCDILAPSPDQISSLEHSHWADAGKILSDHAIHSDDSAIPSKADSIHPEADTIHTGSAAIPSRSVVIHNGAARWRQEPINWSSSTSTALGVSPPTNIIFGDDSPALEPTIPKTKSNPAFTPFRYKTPFPYEIGPKDIYRRLCSPSDPPLSVAICPQRRCVGFGCNSGIDLYWVDGLIGQDYSRWFPLTSPSDYLYFLPLRKGLDSPNQLRLVSSAGLDGLRGCLRPNTFKNDASRQDADSWRAVPLSDGFHILFIDSRTGMLCLGNDDPTGQPARLCRKALFFDPRGRLPQVYAVGRDLTWGPRIVVGFEDELWLFNVPRDIFTFRGTGHTEWSDEYAHRNSRFGDMDPASITSSINDTRSFDLSLIWPVIVRGSYIATVPGLTELAIDSRLASFTVWAFTSGGTARAYQLRRRDPLQRPREMIALKDGSMLVKTIGD